MAAPTFDLAVGVSSGSLDAGLKQLHTGHRALLKGDHTEVVSGVRYSVSWDLREAPRISLGAPDAARWKKTWKQKGVGALPLPVWSNWCCRDCGSAWPRTVARPVS